MRTMLCALAFAVVLSPARAADLPAKDGFLMTALATSSSLERFSNLAIKKTENVEVKKFAEKVAEKSKECKDDLTKWATEKKVGLLAGIEKGREAAYKAMALKTGKDFDVAYLDQVISDLEDADKVMKKADKEEDAKLKELGAKGGKDCKAWLEEARKIKKMSFGDK